MMDDNLKEIVNDLRQTIAPLRNVMKKEFWELERIGDRIETVATREEQRAKDAAEAPAMTPEQSPSEDPTTTTMHPATRRDWRDLPLGVRLVPFFGTGMSKFLGVRKRERLDASGKPVIDDAIVEVIMDYVFREAKVMINGAEVATVTMQSSNKSLLNKCGVSILRAILRERERRDERFAAACEDQDPATPTPVGTGIGFEDSATNPPTTPGEEV